jgi:AmmeMemoRadiSam system protein A
MWDDPAKQAGEVLNIETHRPTEEQQRAMLAVARQAIAASLSADPAPQPELNDPYMAHRAGVFVTLREKRGSRKSAPGRLRGCIGHMQADQALGRLVPEMAVQAATGDPRFVPMKPAELESVKIEVAILSPIWPVESREEIEIGKHGLVLTGERRRALLLPKSPVIYEWDLDQYLANLHRKAGLPVDYWPSQGKLYAFTSFDFGE